MPLPCALCLPGGSPLLSSTVCRRVHVRMPGTSTCCGGHLGHPNSHGTMYSTIISPLMPYYWCMWGRGGLLCTIICPNTVLMLPLLLTHVGLCAMLCTHEGSYGPLYPLYGLMRGCMCHHIITTWDTAGHHYLLCGCGAVSLCPVLPLIPTIPS